MPTFEIDPEFLRDWKDLTEEQKELFRVAKRKLIEDLKAQRPPRASLGIERFESRKDVYEFHWAGNGRALFSWGASPHSGEVHVIWLAIGTHKIYK